MNACPVNTTGRDLYGEMLRACHEWMTAYHPAAEYAAVVVHFEDETPDLMVPFVNPPLACPLPLVPSA